jgi:hypothetical protein
MTPECQAEKDCVADGGVFTPAGCCPQGSTWTATGDRCVPDLPDASQCCNANPDPCCPYLYCDAGITQECRTELDCMEAGAWRTATLSCDLDAGDAGDADSHD